MPRPITTAARLVAFLTHWTDCDSCAAMPLDPNDPNAHKLCDEGVKHWNGLGAILQSQLAQVAGYHALWALEGEVALPAPPPAPQAVQ